MTNKTTILSRERLEEMSQCNDVAKLFAYEMRHMARELLAVREAQEKPAIPDGWKLVPVEPTIEMYNAWVDCRMGFYEDYAEILAAAPEAPPASTEPASQWVKCSERMPPPRTGVLVSCYWGRGWSIKWASFLAGHPDASTKGWLIPGASWEPTHWMPLPAAPGGE